MNKLFTKIAAVVLGATMATGVGVAVASSANSQRVEAAAGDSPVIIDATNLGLTSTATTAETTKSYGGVSYKISSGAKSQSSSGTNKFSASAILIGKSGAYIYNSTALPGTITKFEVYANKGASAKVSVGVKFGTSAITTWNATGAWTQTLSTLDHVYDASSAIVTNATFFRYQVTNANNSQIEFRITYSASSDPTKLGTPSPTFDRASNTITWSPVTNATSYELKVDSGSYATATSGYSVASVSVNDSHTVSVRALASGYTTSEAGEVTFHRYATKGTAADPYTVADARRAIDNNDGVANVYAQGYVKEIPTAYSSQYSNITFNIVDNESDTDFLQAYRCTGTDAANVAIHDTALVSGTLTKYNSTYEFSAGCVLEQLTHPTVTTTYTIEFNVSGGSATVEDIEVGEGLTFTFPSPGTKTDYLFKGWSNDGGTTFHQAGDVSADVYADATYIAYWQTDGTVADPYTVAEAKAAVDAGAGTKGVNVAGKISQVDSYDSSHHSITYWISDDGTTTGQFEVYSGKGLNGADFSAKTDVEVGATVVVCGDIKLYNTTYEFDKNNYQVSYTAPAVVTVTSIEISGSMTNTSYTTTDQWDPTGLTVTATYSDSTTGDVTSSVAWSYDYASPSAMGASASAQTLTITATYQGQTDSTTASVLVSEGTYTNSTHLNPGNYYIAYNDSGTKHYITSIASGKGATDTSKLNALEFNFALVGNDTWEITNGTNYLAVGTTSTSLSLTATETSLTIAWETEANSTRKITGESGRELCWYAGNSDIRTYSGKTDGTNGMTLESVKTVSSFTVDSSSANKNVLKGSTFDAEAAQAAGFVAKLNYTDSTFDNVTALATWTLNTSTVGTATLTVTYESYPAVTINDMNIYSAVMVSLTIDASSAKTTGYWVGDTLDTDNLVITGHDASSNDYPIAIGDVTFSPTTLTTAGSVTITVTYNNDSGSSPATATGTYTVTVSSFAYDKATSINGGDQIIITNTAETKLLSGITTTGTIYGIATDYSGKPVTTNVYTVVAGANDGTVAFKGNDGTNDYYLNWTSGNTLTKSSSVSDSSSWTVTFSNTVATIKNVGDETRVIRFNSDRFATYASSTGSLPTIWKLNGASGQTAAETFAGGFLDDVVNDVCKTNGPTFASDMETMWSLYAETYDALSSEAKAYIASKTANASGDDVEKMLYEYKHIYETYASTLTLSNFIGRIEINKSSAPKVMPSNATVVNSNNAIAIVVIVSMLSVTAIGGYFFLKKRREQN